MRVFDSALGDLPATDAEWQAWSNSFKSISDNFAWTTSRLDTLTPEAALEEILTTQVTARQFRKAMLDAVPIELMEPSVTARPRTASEALFFSFYADCMSLLLAMDSAASRLARGLRWVTPEAASLLRFLDFNALRPEEFDPVVEYMRPIAQVNLYKFDVGSLNPETVIGEQPAWKSLKTRFDFYLDVAERTRGRVPRFIEQDIFNFRVDPIQKYGGLLKNPVVSQRPFTYPPKERPVMKAPPIKPARPGGAVKGLGDVSSERDRYQAFLRKALDLYRETFGSLDREKAISLILAANAAYQARVGGTFTEEEFDREMSALEGELSAAGANALPWIIIGGLVLGALALWYFRKK